MKLLYVLTAVLALTLAEEEKKEIENVANIEKIEDSEAAAATIEILKEGTDLNTAASAYNYVSPSQRPPQWQAPHNNWEAPKQPGVPDGVQNDYYWGNTNAPVYHPPTTTTQVPVIKNEQYIGDNGNYHYEYQTGDGTHVGEQGWFSSPKQDEDSLVKKGWYSFVGADGVTYTVTYWADKTGYHAYGDHLPKVKQPEKENIYRPQHDYPTQTPAPQPAKPTQPAYVPTQPPYVPTQPTYNPTQKPIYIQPQQPSYDTPQNPTYKPTQQPIYIPPQQPTYNPPQQPTYNPPQQPTYNPPQQPTYNPPQQPTYNPPQQYYPPQQTYYPTQQQTYYPPQNNYVPQYNV